MLFRQPSITVTDEAKQISELREALRQCRNERQVALSENTKLTNEILRLKQALLQVPQPKSLDSAQTNFKQKFEMAELEIKNLQAQLSQLRVEFQHREAEHAESVQ